MRKGALWLLLTALLLALAGTADGSREAGPPASPPAPSLQQERGRRLPRGPKEPRLAHHLSRLADLEEALALHAQDPLGLLSLPPDLSALLSAGLARRDPQGRVQVFVYADDVEAAAGAVGALGGLVERLAPAEGIVQGWVPLARLRALAARPGVRFLDLPTYPVLSVGSVTSQGDAALQASALRNTLGLTGRGVRVGVISDGVRGLQESQALGDLPSVNTSDCDLGPGDRNSAGAEGTALLEIVHDLAPGAELWFGYFGAALGTVLDFNAVVGCLARRVDIIVDDINWFNAGPYDGSSVVSRHTAAALNDPTNRLRAYITAVGNQATAHYQESYSPCPGPQPFHLFAATAATQDRGGLGSRCDNPVLVPAGGTLRVVVQWDDPWGASCNDYDVYLFAHDSSTPLAASQNFQFCAQNPTEMLVWQNPSTSPALVDLVLAPIGPVQPRTFDIFFLGGSPNYNTAASSVPNQADAAGGVLAVGAINAFDEGRDQIAPYSSRGPTNDGRLKPEVTGIDGVSVTGSGGFVTTFLGTSAAAPHIAGILALLLECRPSLKAGEPGDSPAQERLALRNALLLTAVDLGPPGSDNTFGAGRADALAAGRFLCQRTTVLWGDVDCSTTVDSADALVLLRASLGLSTPQQESCPQVGQSVGNRRWGDLDCNGLVNSADAQRLLRFTLGLTVAQPTGCPQLGTLVSPG
jgi:subtilisin family serine protease